MKKIFALILVIALCPLQLVTASDEQKEPQFIPHRELSKQFLGQDRKKQAQIDRQAYRSEQSTPEARKELVLEMKQLKEGKRAPASK
jgi:hypothetical protein